MLLADDLGVERAAERSQRVDCGVEALRSDGALERYDRVEVAEGRGHAWVGVVVGGHVDRLERSDRALVGRGDALFQFTHLGRQGRLVADGGGHPTEQRRYFLAGEGVTVDVVDEQQHVLALLVAEVLGEGQAGQRDPQAHAGRLVHLTEDQHGLVQHAGLAHLVPEVVALARALAHAGEDGVAAVLGGDVADQFLNDDGLADACAAVRANLAASGERADQVDDLDPGLEDGRLGGLLLERGRRAVNRRADAVGRHLAEAVQRLAEHVEETPQRNLADGNGDRLAEVGRVVAALHAVGGVHREAACAVVAEVLLHLSHDLSAAAHRDRHATEQRGQTVGRELDIDDRADHLNY